MEKAILNFHFDYLKAYLMHSIDLFHLFQMYSFLPIGFREMVKYCLEEFFRSKLPHTFLQKTAFSLLKSRLAKGSLGCLFFGFSHNAGYQLQKTTWKPSLKALLALVETIGRRFSFLLQRTFSSSILARSWTRLLLLIPLFDTTSEYCKHIW